MNLYGIFDTDLNMFIHTYSNTRMTSFGSKYSASNYIHLEFLGEHTAGHSWNGTNVVYDSEYAPVVKKEYNIYSKLPTKTLHTDSLAPPFDIDYKNGLTSNLYPKRTFIKGELIGVVWYGSYDPEQTENEGFSAPIIDVAIAYTRDVLGFAVSRQTTRKWYFIDGELDQVNAKITHKYYTGIDQIKEGKIRRGNIMDYVPIAVLGLLITTELPKPGTPYADEAALILEGRRFLAEHKVSLINFVDDSNDQILAALAADTTHWLDNDIGGGTTIRAYLISEFDIGAA